MARLPSPRVEQGINSRTDLAELNRDALVLNLQAEVVGLKRGGEQQAAPFSKGMRVQDPKMRAFRWLLTPDITATGAILVFHWLFTLKLLGGSVRTLSSDVIDVIRLVLAVLAVLSLLWHSLTSWPIRKAETAREPRLLNGLRMNAAFLSAVSLITLLIALPFTINHRFLEFYVALLLLILNTKWSKSGDDYSIISSLFLSVWWIAAIQKLVNGRFLNGETFMVAWDTNRPPDLGKTLETIRAIFPNTEVHHLFVGLAVIVFLSELLLPLCIIFNRQRRYLWYGMFALQLGSWQATGERDFAMTGLTLCFLGLTGPDARVRSCSLVPKTIFMALVIWPFLHMGLANAYSFSPWRLGGWGMYSTPDFMQEYDVVFNVRAKKYSFLEIPWPADQVESLARDRRLYIEFNSESARRRLEGAFRDLVASKYRSDAQVIRVRRHSG